MLPDLLQTKFFIEIKQVEEAHLVSRSHKLVWLSATRNFELDHGVTHCEVPLELTMVIILLIFVEAGEVVHACFDFLGYEVLEWFVGGPIAGCEDFDVELDGVFLGSAFGHAFLFVVPVSFCLVLGKFQVIHHALNAIFHLP